MLIRTATMAWFALISFGLIGCGNSRSEAPTPPAKPIVVKSELDVNVLSSNQALVWVRNDGQDGKVQVLVRWYGNKEKVVRGESGLEKTARETFTRDTAPPNQVVTERKLLEVWVKDIELAAGETKKVTMTLSGHSSLHGDCKVYAVAKSE